MSRTYHHRNQRFIRRCGHYLGRGSLIYSAYNKWLSRKRDRAQGKRKTKTLRNKE